MVYTREIMMDTGGEGTKVGDKILTRTKKIGSKSRGLKGKCGKIKC